MMTKTNHHKAGKIASFSFFSVFTHPFHDESSISLSIVIGRRWKRSIWRAALLAGAGCGAFTGQDANSAAGPI
jgi:hypothetical protein